MTRLETVKIDGVDLLATVGDGWRACFSTRLGGVSRDPFAELNISLMVGDDAGLVLQNRARLGKAAGFDPAALVVGHQVHGVRVTSVTAAQRGRGAGDREGALPCTDALLTDEPDLPVLVSTADCVPVILAAHGRHGAAVAVVHAGWRGMLDGIVARAALELRRRGQLAAAIVGPSIGPCCFSVGEDVGRAFQERFAGTWSGGRVDLWTAATRQLATAGVPAAQILVPRLCTVCDRRFFSHRRDRGRTGRQAAVAWVTAPGETDAQPQGLRETTKEAAHPVSA